MGIRSSAEYRRYLEVVEGVMGAGKPMFRGCVLDHARPSPPSAGEWEHFLVTLEDKEVAAETVIRELKPEHYK